MILALGNPVYDHIETKKIKTDGRVLSGCSTNAALALARLKNDVTLVGAIGADFAAAFAASMSQWGVATKRLPSQETGGFSLIYYDDFGNRHLDLLGRADAIDGVPDDLLGDAEPVLVGPILQEISLALIENIRSRFAGLFFCDPQGLLRTAGSDNRIVHEKPVGIEKALGLFDIVKPNELEGLILTGVDCRRDPFTAARVIKSWGPKIVIITLAELGSVIYDGREFIEIPPYEVDLIDATGAGDTYMAGFVHAYLRGESLRQCGTFASAVSSIMIEQIGPQFRLDEISARRRQAQLLTQTGFKVQLITA